MGRIKGVRVELLVVLLLPAAIPCGRVSMSVPTVHLTRVVQGEARVVEDLLSD